MKHTLFQKMSLLLLCLASANLIVAQTTAYDFQGDDCNGNPVHLYEDLDAGKAVVLFFYMPNCGSCPPPAQKIQTMANNINANFPGKVKAYAYPYQNSTTCAYSASWVTNNNLSLYAPMDSGAYQVAYYGGFGMPTVVLLGRSSHDVMFSTQNFVTSDTTTMRDLILSMLNSTEELNQNQSAVKLFPNPANQDIRLEFELTAAGSVTYQISDLGGKKISESNSEHLPAGKHHYQLPVSALAEGMYLVTLSANGTRSTHQFTVKH